MKTLAVASNLAQLIIILTVFYIQGPELGTPVIFLLFLLMPVPFINFLAILFGDRRIRLSAKTEGNAMIKREAMRVHYPADRCPVMIIGGTAFPVRDLSEGGVCIEVAAGTPFKKKVNGEIQLLSGDLLRFKATVIRREDGEAVLGFTDPIGTAVLREELNANAAAPAG